MFEFLENSFLSQCFDLVETQFFKTITEGCYCTCLIFPFVTRQNFFFKNYSHTRKPKCKVTRQIKERNHPLVYTKGWLRSLVRLNGEVFQDKILDVIYVSTLLGCHCLLYVKNIFEYRFSFYHGFKKFTPFSKIISIRSNSSKIRKSSQKVISFKFCISWKSILYQFQSGCGDFSFKSLLKSSEKPQSSHKVANHEYLLVFFLEGRTPGVYLFFLSFNSTSYSTPNSVTTLIIFNILLIYIGYPEKEICKVIGKKKI